MLRRIYNKTRKTPKPLAHPKHHPLSYHIKRSPTAQNDQENECMHVDLFVFLASFLLFLLFNLSGVLTLI